ncbi:MAG: hypothetical protein K0S98_1517 [Propionibacteriaceae bacterium]|nr:hypothetical protein [Propionibacteriaceae bacterium]
MRRGIVLLASAATCPPNHETRMLTRKSCCCGGVWLRVDTLAIGFVPHESEGSTPRPRALVTAQRRRGRAADLCGRVTAKWLRIRR